MESVSRLKSRPMVALLAVFSLVLFTACGGDENDDPSPTGNTGAISSGSQDSGDLAENQVLRLSMNSEPSTIDPHLSSIGNEISIERQLFSGLFTYDEDLNVVPALATAMPTVANGGISQDGKTYTIELQESTWSDGSALTANDFVYSMLRALDPEVASPYAWAFYGIEGAAAYNGALDTEEGTPAPPASEIEDLRSQVGVKADGDYKVVYTLEAPDPSFLNVLTLVTAFPVKQSVIEQYGDAWTDAANFIGNGPFVLSSWQPGSKITLGRNDSWYGPAPTLTSIDVSFIADDAVAFNAYTAGDIDATVATTASLASGANQGELTVTPLLSTYALFMNNASDVFDDALVREAFGAAIDRDAYVNVVLQGAGAPTTSWVPPGMPGYNEALGQNMSYDVEGAQELLTEAGFEGGEGLGEVNFVMISSDYNTLVAQFVEEQLESNLGVEVTFEFFDQGQYFDELGSGAYDATIQNWFADWPSPDNFLNLFHSESDMNLAAYSNPEYDELLNNALLAVNADARLGFYDEAQAVLLEDAGIAPMYNEINNTYVKPTVLDLIITGIDGALKGDLFFWKTKIIKPDGN